MNYKAHLVGGIAFGAGTLYTTHRFGIALTPILVIGGATIGSILPDIDHPKSFLGRRIPLIPKLIYRTVGHRTLTHSLLFALAISFLIRTFNNPLAIGVLAGIVSHILLDMLTPQGVSYLYPFRRKRIRWF
ncbi:MAG: metal-dependent hydrolase [Cellulosilyticaceae bacterium]